MGLSLHQRSDSGKHVAIGTRHTFRLSRQPSTAPEISPDVSSYPRLAESAGMSKAAFDRIEDHLKQRYIESGRFPGTQLLVYRRGKVVHSTVQGLADVERKAPVKDDTIFRIYSMTKPITSVAFMMLSRKAASRLTSRSINTSRNGRASAFSRPGPRRPF